MKYIAIEHCGRCPHKDHKGAFAQVAYIPVCKLADKELPYTTQMINKRIVASVTPDITDWCPLPDLKE